MPEAFLTEKELNERDYLCELWASRKANSRQIARCMELQRRGVEEWEAAKAGSKVWGNVGGNP